MNYYTKIKSPVGQLLLTAKNGALTGIYFDNVDKQPDLNESWLHKADHPVLKMAGQQLDEYFKLQRQQFDIPLEAAGTAFQKQVWEALIKIPFGATQSYGQIAKAIDNPKAVRAVGLANGANPIAIVVPCHRVIGSDGSLTGYGGGLERKKLLLTLEKASKV